MSDYRRGFTRLWTHRRALIDRPGNKREHARTIASLRELFGEWFDEAYTMTDEELERARHPRPKREVVETRPYGVKDYGDLWKVSNRGETWGT